MGASGLTNSEVLARRSQYGENRLPAGEEVSAWAILLGQFKSPLVYVVLAAAGISLSLGEFGDFGIIMAVVVVDVILGFTQEYRAQRTYAALLGLLKPTTTVIREGQRLEIQVWELVPDDVVVLATGDKVPADGDLLETSRLAIDEAVLTGESEPVGKHSATNHKLEHDGGPIAASTPLGAEELRLTRAFMGSVVVTGRGVMQVTATGLHTELGQIAASLQKREEGATPLQVRLAAFSRMLSWAVIGLTAAILLVGMVSGREFFDMLRTSIILAIAAIPEGLIIAVTVILVLGMRRILNRQGLVKRMLAVETLGSVSVICTDKTGTLTEGRMRVNRVDLTDQRQAIRTMVLCNDLEGPVDVALWEYAAKQLNADPQLLVDDSQRVAEELFSSETKFMITASRSESSPDARSYYLKGAPEIVLGMCQLSPAEHDRLATTIEQWASAGLRLLGLADRTDGYLEDHSGYTWLGLVGMEDPIREGVAQALELSRRAGIQTKMITGDYLRTAESIAASIGLPVIGPSLEGKDVAALSDEQLREQVAHTSVFARIRPADKLRIVQALQANGKVTAMIGDGVNDAPALALANISVVVGSATDVSTEIADLILLDSNFRTVVAAVEEGRVIFDNLRKVVAYVLSNSFAEVLLIFVAMLLGWPAPLTVAQILWIHLICDGPVDIVLGFEPAEAGVMDRKPRPVTEPVLDSLGASLIGTISIASAAFGLVMFGYLSQALADPVAGRSIVFAGFCINSLVYLFAYRSMRTPLHRMNPVTANKPLLWAVIAGFATTLLPFLVPPLGALLGIAPLSLLQWSWVAGFAVGLLGLVELAKAIHARRHR